MVATDEIGFDALDVAAFVAELLLWAGCGAAAYSVAGGGPSGAGAATVTIAVVILEWGIVMAPRSPRRLRVTGRALVVLVLAVAACWALGAHDAVRWECAVVVASLVMLFADGRRRSSRAVTTE